MNKTTKRAGKKKVLTEITYEGLIKDVGGALSGILNQYRLPENVVSQISTAVVSAIDSIATAHITYEG